MIERIIETCDIQAPKRRKKAGPGNGPLNSCDIERKTLRLTIPVEALCSSLVAIPISSHRITEIIHLSFPKLPGVLDRGGSQTITLTNPRTIPLLQWTASSPSQETYRCWDSGNLSPFRRYSEMIYQPIRASAGRGFFREKRTQWRKNVLDCRSASLTTRLPQQLFQCEKRN